MNSVRTLRARFALASLVCLTTFFFSSVILFGSGLRQTGPPSKPPERITTGQRSFEIPFSVNATQGNVVEVVLQSSSNLGKTWKEHSRRTPSASGFPFSSQTDGEYWFAIQTIDRNGHKQPADKALRAELKIAIDTIRPTLEFEVRPDGAGRIVGVWSARDPNIDPCSMTIQYQSEASGDENWYTVPTQTCQKNQSSLYRDELAWWPQTTARNLKIRATVKDLAGNSAEVVRTMIVPLVAGGAPPVPTGNHLRRQPPVVSHRAVSSPQTPAASGRISETATNYQRSRMPIALARDYGENQEPQNARRPDANIPAKLTSNGGSVTSSGDHTPQPPRSQKRFAQNTPADSEGASLPDSSVPQSTQWRSRSSGPDNTQVTGSSTQPSKTSWSPPDSQPQASVARQENPTTGIRVEGNTVADRNSLRQEPASATAQWISSTTGEIRQPVPAASSVLASGPKLESLRAMARPTNSRRFQLDYDIDAIGPEGVKTIELWITPDGGTNWRRLTTDNDKRSPVNVEVQSDGIFGFRILVVSNEGLRAKQPRQGDPADMWVNVDTTLPSARITAVPYGRGQDAGRLLIQWKASDANLHLRPVKLLYSPRPEGPWTTIEDGVRNEGQYAWKPGVDIPDKVYLRLEVRDRAGNVQQHLLDRPIDISGLVPRGHIRGITPLQEQTLDTST